MLNGENQKLLGALMEGNKQQRDQSLKNTSDFNKSKFKDTNPGLTDLRN